MNKRLHQIRKYFKLSQEEFGRRLGVTGTSISRLESGERSITEQMLLSICRVFNISATWMKTGDGDMIVEVEDQALSQLSLELGLDNFAIRAIKAYQKLDEQGRNAIQQYISLLTSEDIDSKQDQK